MATSYSIIKNHNGYIQVESEIGAGTVFHVYLPASEKGARTEQAAGAEAGRGGGKVLIMDDEEMIRSVTGDMLRHIGYEVDFAKDGAEAISKYAMARESGRPFDAVILDLTVAGGMGGKDALRKLVNIDPNVKAIVSSGYSNDPILADFTRHGFQGMAAKPYRIDELRSVFEFCHRRSFGTGCHAVSVKESESGHYATK